MKAILKQLEAETQALICKADADYEQNIIAAKRTRQRAIQNAKEREGEIKWQLGLDSNAPFRGLFFDTDYPIIRDEMWTEYQQMLDKMRR